MSHEKDFTFFIGPSSMVLYWFVSWHLAAVILALLMPVFWWVKGFFLVFILFSLAFYRIKYIRKNRSFVLHFRQGCLSLTFNGVIDAAAKKPATQALERPLCLIGEQRIFPWFIELNFQFISSQCIDSQCIDSGPKRSMLFSRLMRSGFTESLVITKDSMSSQAFHELKVFVKTYAAS